MKSDNYCTLYIARHGQTEWNVKGLVQGHTDSPLTSEGIAQAANLARELKKIKFDAAYSSDLMRAKRTAEIVALEHELVVKTSEALRERNFGPFEGKNKKVLDLLEELRTKQISYETQNIESDEQITVRVITLLREIAVAYAGKIVLVVTHGGILISLLVHLGYFTHEELRSLHVGNTSYIKVVSDGVDFWVKETKRIEKRDV